MSCYTRHLGDRLPPDPTSEDRRALDEAVRAELGMKPTADCPEVWAAYKAAHGGTDRSPAPARARGEV